MAKGRILIDVTDPDHAQPALSPTLMHGALHIPAGALGFNLLETTAGPVAVIRCSTGNMGLMAPLSPATLRCFAQRFTETADEIERRAGDAAAEALAKAGGKA